MYNYIITLMTEPEHSLSIEEVEALANALGATEVEWTVPPLACDLSLTCAVVLPYMPADLHLPPFIDIVLQPLAHRRKKLLIADMESTIIRNEFLDELAEFVGKKAEVSAITARAMNGELDFEAALNARVALLAGLPESVLDEVWTRVEYMPGAHALLAGMRAEGAYTMLVSGGFDVFAARVAAALGFDEYRANRLEIINGTLTGRVIPPVLGKEAKEAALRETCAARGILLEETLAVGDGANDVPMLVSAGLGVAYHAKPMVREAAHHRINHCDLRALLWMQGIKTTA